MGDKLRDKLGGKKNMNQKLIVALDVPNVNDAKNIVNQIGDEVGFYKIGYQLFYAQGGPEFVRELKKQSKKIFLDLKLLDIDNTIKKGISNVCEMKVDMLTVHAYPKTMNAAVKALNDVNEVEGGNGGGNDNDLTLLGVTVLTSMDDNDLKEAGYSMTADELVQKRVRQAKDAGMGGVVASAKEAKKIRQIIGNQMDVVTPGIRPKGADKGDQKRVMSPEEAIKAGASHLVVGRPIVEAKNKRDVAKMINEEIQKAEGDM